MRLSGLIALVAAGLAVPAEAQNLSLAGRWRFQLDRHDVGMQERWFARALPDQIQLPGGLTEQGVGDPVTSGTSWIGGIVDTSWFTAPEFAKYRQPGDVKIPFWLQPDLYYAGAAWFQREVEIPKSWRGRRAVLFLERAHWETRVWVDGVLIGTNTTLATPHEYDLGALAPGKHSLTIRVDNRMIVDVGENSHSVSDHTQGNWNGIVGRVELRARPAAWIADVQVYPQVATRSVVVKGQLARADGQSPAGVVELLVKSPARGASPVRATAAAKPDGTFAASLALGTDAPLWDEFSPALHELTVRVAGDNSADGRYRVRFGLREIAAEGSQFTINGRITFFRGTLECAIFPRTGHPPTEVAEWRRILRVAKGHGLNLIRFHSWCPPEAAFEAADELGMYLQVECSSWPNQSTSLGDGRPVDRWIYEEADRILKAYGNHPSFVLFVCGNEPGGRRHKEFLAEWVAHYRARDPRRLVSSGAGWPQIPENQFHVTPEPRIQAWGEGLKSRINAKPPETTTDYRAYIARRPVPVISHEIGQWCVYPNFNEIPKYSGYLKPRNFEIFRERLEANGMGKLGKQFLLASGKLQTLCYKEDIESALRTPGMGGFQLLDLHDFPGQGTALVGVLDPFWEAKGYVTAAEYRRFCNATVPLARLPKRVFTNGETLSATLEVAHYGAAPLTNTVLEWKLTDGRAKILARGELTRTASPRANLVAFGNVSVDLRRLVSPAQCKLVAKVRGTDFENDWDLWVYPAPTGNESGAVLITASFDDSARARLAAGGNVLLTIPGERVRNFEKDPVALGFSGIFWNTAWTKRQPPTTLGIRCDPKHPAFADFPTDFHSNWQWWYLLHRAGALRLDLLPRDVKPIVRVIDDWVTARPLGLMVEGRVGPGKVIVCGFDLTEAALNDPVSRQLRHSLLAYMHSKKFQPATRLSEAQIAALIAEPRPNALRAAKAKADSEQVGYAAELAIDGKASTFWHTAWAPVAAPFPHELIVELPAPVNLRGFTALPRQDGNRNGRIKDYEFYTSPDGVNWGAPAAIGTFSDYPRLQTVKLGNRIRAKFVKLVARSAHSNGDFASLAELEVLRADQ
jgi:hypothetical protein